MNPQRLARVNQSSVLDADAEHDKIYGIDSKPEQRKLVDYTVSPCNRRCLVPKHGLISNCSLVLIATTDKNTSTAIDDQPQELVVPPNPRLNLPSFLYLEEKSIHGSASNNATEESSKQTERIDFFLKVRKPRRSSNSSIRDLRAELGNKMRSRKSCIFGSFSENGERRSSYTDLKRVMAQGKGIGDLNF